MLNNTTPLWESTHWALCRARYFDTSEQRFRLADIEISEGRITALLSPGASVAKLRVDGSDMTCVPGLIGELVVDCGDDEFDFCTYAHDAVERGITTMSVLTDRPVDVSTALRRAGLRAEIYCGVRDQSLGHSLSDAVCDVTRALDVHRTLIRTLDNGLVRISPAIRSQSFASSHLTVQLHAFAKANARRLLVNVDSGRPHHNAFHDAYGCSGSLLLRSLGVLDTHTIALLDPTLSRHDLNLLADSATGVAIVDPTMLTKGTPASRILRRILRSGRGALMCRRTDADARSATVARSSRAFGWASLRNVQDIADIIINTMTHAGSAALGLSAIGRIDPGAYADFAIYDSPISVDSAASTVTDSWQLLDLIATHRPRSVIIDGQWRLHDYQRPVEMRQGPAIAPDAESGFVRPVTTGRPAVRYPVCKSE